MTKRETLREGYMRLAKKYRVNTHLNFGEEVLELIESHENSNSSDTTALKALADFKAQIDAAREQNKRTKIDGNDWTLGQLDGIDSGLEVAASIFNRLFHPITGKYAALIADSSAPAGAMKRTEETRKLLKDMGLVEVSPNIWEMPSAPAGAKE
jgi:hypothetical protein